MKPKRMKVFTTLLLFAIGIISYGQIKKCDFKKPLKEYQSKKYQTEKAHLSIEENTFALKFGDFEIQSFYILKRDTPPTKELELLIGSFVRVQEKSITGNEIDPLKIEFTGLEKMSRSDYIYRFFGREIRAKEPDLPEVIKVHTTSNEDCKGIVEIDQNTLGIPYKGVLLIGKRK